MTNQPLLDTSNARTCGNASAGEIEKARPVRSLHQSSTSLQERPTSNGARPKGGLIGTDIVGHIYSELRRTRPKTRRDLKNYVKVFLGLDIPDKRICTPPEAGMIMAGVAGHSSPMDYLWHSFSADFPPEGQSVHGRQKRANADAIIWANRAGGKTELAAVATLLDCIFKPSCQVRILGGSGEQSGRMYEYLTGFLRSGPAPPGSVVPTFGGFEEFLAAPALKAKCRFANNSTAEVLTQSATSVRGQHIQKLRCDEVELFDEDVFAAAKFTTQSTTLSPVSLRESETGPVEILAAMEMISTMHRPYGLMQRIVSSAPQSGTPVFKWCIWEVIEKCTDRSCSRCPLWTDCQGKAKKANGYLKIDDCITQMRRASRAGWEAEMLCKRPSLENVVFDEFDPAVHVQPVDYDPNLPLYRTLDFGFVNPFVCLWIQVDGTGIVRVIDEYVRSRATIDVHAAEIKSRIPGGQEQVAATFCDPAGRSVNDVTGTSAVRELRALGIVVRFRRSGILEGIELIRRAIRDGCGQSTLIISPRCQRLIEAMQCYHYPEPGSAAAGELPLKDGIHDHPIDALRYFFVNYKHTSKTISRRY